MQELTPIQIAQRLDQLTELTVELGGTHDAAHNTDTLLEHILLVAKRMTHADGGTLYRPSDDRRALDFHIMLNDTLGIHQGGPGGAPIAAAAIPLYDGAGEKNLSAVAAYAAHSGKSVNIEDVYQAGSFNFSGMVSFDRQRQYRSQSILTVPMRDHEGELVGVLQLINARATDHADGAGPGQGTAIVPFSPTDQRFIEALAAQAAVALTHQRLIAQLEELLESLVNLINIGIDEKSPYTGRHCQFVPELTMMLAEAVHDTQTGPLAGFRMTDADRKELWMAGLLHDCGKITTPVHIVDKATKLETIFDRIALIDTRFDVLLRDAQIAALERKLAAAGAAPAAIVAANAADNAANIAANIAAIELDLARQQQALRDDRDFLRAVNVGGEGMAAADQARVHTIAARRWTGPDGVERDFLDADEILNLTIPYGTLTAAERQIVNNHISVTIRMLEALPWPRHLRHVPEYAGGHHERMDGKGYPRGLTGDQMSVQARLMAIADIFEALTARDRPYKKGKMLSESLHILGKFALNGHIDPQLFDIFIRSGIYHEFAARNMDARQIDTVDVAQIPGYVP
ncbi:MAG: HD domain-containing phosphohydrolase [Duganella sp.]